jgi:hypothetical protein
VKSSNNLKDSLERLEGQTIPAGNRLAIPAPGQSQNKQKNSKKTFATKMKLIFQTCNLIRLEQCFYTSMALQPFLLAEKNVLRHRDVLFSLTIALQQHVV